VDPLDAPAEALADEQINSGVFRVQKSGCHAVTPLTGSTLVRCCPSCHEQGALRRVTVEGTTARVCCSVLTALLVKGPHIVVLFDEHELESWDEPAGRPA
jgi:hypothetical protein